MLGLAVIGRLANIFIIPRHSGIRKIHDAAQQYMASHNAVHENPKWKRANNQSIAARCAIWPLC